MLKPQSKYPFTIHTFRSCPRLSAFCTTSSFWSPSRDPASWIFSGKGMLRCESSSFTKGSQDFSKGSKFRRYCLSRPSMDGFKEKPTGNSGNHRFSKLGKRLVCHLLRQQWLNFNYGWRPKQGSPPKMERHGHVLLSWSILLFPRLKSQRISTSSPQLDIVFSQLSTHQVFGYILLVAWQDVTTNFQRSKVSRLASRCSSRFKPPMGQQCKIPSQPRARFFFVCPFKSLKVIKWLWKKCESW